MKKDLFKTCPNCSKLWNTLEDFLNDPELKLAGYQVHFDDLEGGLFFFTHHQESCFTTLAIPVTAFRPLTDRPLLTKRDEKLCSGSEFCVRQGALTPNPAECECAWVHDILHVISNWKKQAV